MEVRSYQNQDASFFDFRSKSDLFYSANSSLLPWHAHCQTWPPHSFLVWRTNGEQILIQTFRKKNIPGWTKNQMAGWAQKNCLKWHFLSFLILAQSLKQSHIIKIWLWRLIPVAVYRKGLWTVGMVSTVILIWIELYDDDNSCKLLSYNIPRHCAKHITCVISFIPHDNLARDLLYLFYRWETGNTERLRNIPRFM